MVETNHIENNSTTGAEADQPPPIYREKKPDSSPQIGLIRKEKVRKAIARKAFIANTCLLVWAILLAVIGMQAVSGKASTVILDIANKIANTTKQSPPKQSTTSEIANTTEQSPPKQPATPEVETDFLRKYIASKYPGLDETSIPPVAIVLDRLQVSVNWRDAAEINDANGKTRNTPNQDDYNSLFDIVAKRLEAIADFSPEVSVSSNLKISNNIMPLKFRSTDVASDNQKFQKFQEQDIDLPIEAVLWIKARQAAYTARKSQIGFLDLFVLLIILGGFGSWVYLVRRHIDPAIKVDLYEYFYRPPLGMTLAIAVFIVNISLHSLVSTSSISEVRRETLILLAFTAGLLSDKTYDFIEKATGERLSGNNNKTNDLLDGNVAERSKP